MIGIGLVGIGFMGMIHYLAAERLPAGRGRVTALCSRDPRKLDGDWTDIHGNFGPRGEQMDLGDRARYRSFDELLADVNVQLVDLCVPNDQHAEMAIRALKAGKHVLVEKPIALDLADADRMVAAAREAGRLLMVAHVLPFFPGFDVVLASARDGRYGRLLAGHMTRVISKPDWSAAIGDAARSGGPAIDLHIHDTHFVGVLNGPPRAVRSRGVVRDGAVVHLTTQYLYPEAGAPALSAVSGALCQPGRSFTHGFEFYFERATLSLGAADAPDSGPVSSFVIYPRDGGVEHPEAVGFDPIDAFAAELSLAVDGVYANEEPAELSASLARQALATCLAEVRSVLTGEEVIVA